MSNNYQLGDVEVRTLRIVSERGVTDLNGSFVSASVYESIFTPGIVCDIKVLDMNDQLGQLRLSGDETVLFDFYVMGSETTNYVFALHEMGELENVGAQKGKMYVLKCVSEEAMFAKTNFVQKSYNQLCSEMVEDIHLNYLKSIKPINVEMTRAPQKIVIPHKNPYEAITMIKRRSVSSDEKSSLYVYFENRQNEQQTLNFVTVESLFKQSPVKSFQMSDASNVKFLKRGDDNIIAYKIPNQFSSTEKIALGGPRRVTTFNFTTWKFETKNVETNDANFADGGKGTTTSSTFKNKYYTADIPPQAFIPVDISQKPETFIPESTPDLQAYVALLMQNSVRIKVIGDTVLTAGTTIDCEFPNRRATTGSVTEDPLITGKFLITRIHHRIGELADKPRYTCSVEAIKGRYEESI
jgi:hypothetical protein